MGPPLKSDPIDDECRTVRSIHFALSKSQQPGQSVTVAKDDLRRRSRHDAGQ